MDNAIEGTDRNCEAFADGITVRVADDIVYEPDAVVRCGQRLTSDIVEINDPLIVVEVLSPSTSSIDYGEKLRHYFSLPSEEEGEAEN